MSKSKRKRKCGVYESLAAVERERGGVSSGARVGRCRGGPGAAGVVVPGGGQGAAPVVVFAVAGGDGGAGGAGHRRGGGGVGRSAKLKSLLLLKKLLHHDDQQLENFPQSVHFFLEKLSGNSAKKWTLPGIFARRLEMVHVGGKYKKKKVGIASADK